MSRTKGSGWGGGIILYQRCPCCGKKKAYFDPLTFGVPVFKCTSCKERFSSVSLIRRTHSKEVQQ